jgi:glucose-6-phosphate isomerase
MLMAVMEPSASRIELQTGVLDPCGQVLRRRLSDMQAMFTNEAARQELQAQEGDRLVYEVYVAEIPETGSHILHCTTVIQPGRVADEFFMTKGHFHAVRDRAEIYLGLAGLGCMLVQTDEGETRLLEMQPGTLVYVPPFWAHRTINTGHEPFALFAAWPGDAGHDYGTIETKGFAKILVARDGKAALVDNPRYA